MLKLMYKFGGIIMNKKVIIIIIAVLAVIALGLGIAILVMPEPVAIQTSFHRIIL